MLSDSMKKNPLSYKYINHMLNICYLTGFVREPEQGKGFLLQQNNNFAQALPITVGPGDRIPKDKTPVTLLCHLYGTTDEEGDQQLVIKVIDIQKPSVRSMPALATWARGTSKTEQQTDFRPFAPSGAVVSEDPAAIEAGTNFTDSEQILRDILEATRGRLDSRLGDNANVVLLAGFINSMAYINPNEHQRSGYGAVQLRQHADIKKNLPIVLKNDRAPGAERAIMKQVGIGFPVSMVGQVRYKIIPNEDGTVKKRLLFVRVPDLYRADREKDIREVPEWWASMRDSLVEEVVARKKAKEDAKKAEKPDLVEDL